MKDELAKQAKRAYDRNQEQIAALMQQIQMALGTQAAQLRNGANWEHVCSLADIKDKLQDILDQLTGGPGHCGLDPQPE